MTTADEVSVVAWMASALCRERPPAMLFPSDGVGVQAAKQVCASCPVRAAYLEFALANQIEHGVWESLRARTPAYLEGQPGPAADLRGRLAAARVGPFRSPVGARGRPRAIGTQWITHSRLRVVLQMVPVPSVSPTVDAR